MKLQRESQSFAENSVAENKKTDTKAFVIWPRQINPNQISNEINILNRLSILLELYASAQQFMLIHGDATTRKLKIETFKIKMKTIFSHSTKKTIAEWIKVLGYLAWVH